MRSRASLVLMEQLILILVFALVAAVCLGCFAVSDRMSREMALQDQALALAQSGAEALKASRGDPQAAVAMAADNAELRMEVHPLSSQIPGLGLAEVHVISQASGETVFSLTVGWQEEEG